MKKMIALLLALTLIGGLCACGEQTAATTTKSTAATEASEKVTEQTEPSQTASTQEPEIDLGAIAEVRAALFTPTGTFDREQVVALLLPLAEQGNAEAAYYMGYLGYFHRYPDKEETEEWFLKAAEGGSVKALVGLAFVYTDGWGTAVDREKGEDYFAQAVAAGFPELSKTALGPDGLQYLGMLYQFGYGIGYDDAQAQACYEEAIEQGNTSAMSELSFLYIYNYDEASIQTGVEWLFKGAELGDIRCMHEAATLYESEFYSAYVGGELDYGKAHELYLKAAELGNQYSMHNLGAQYYNGNGVAADKYVALEWYKKAAEGTDLNNGYSMYTVGTWYEWENDVETAFEWYEKGAQTGDNSAIVALASAYRDGRGTDVDYEKAMEWFLQAAQWDVYEAIMAIGDLYANGQGVPQDAAKAQEWYDKAESLYANYG